MKTASLFSPQVTKYVYSSLILNVRWFRFDHYKKRKCNDKTFVKPWCEPAHISICFELNHCNQGCVINGGCRTKNSDLIQLQTIFLYSEPINVCDISKLLEKADDRCTLWLLILVPVEWGVEQIFLYSKVKNLENENLLRSSLEVITIH